MKRLSFLALLLAGALGFTFGGQGAARATSPCGCVDCRCPDCNGEFCTCDDCKCGNCGCAA